MNDQAFLAPYLAATPILDHDHPAVRAMAATLTTGLVADTDRAEVLFRFTRDAILHSVDHRRNPVTCRASDVLAQGTGFCYAKSHLLVAMLRSAGLPAGLCYQRLVLDPARDMDRFCLHGLAAVHLAAHGWYRLDPRGNKPGLDARFTPPLERLAFPLRHPGEVDLPGIHVAPLPAVLRALARHATWEALLSDLPDCPAPAV